MTGLIPFATALAEANLDQASLAAALKTLGDPAQMPAINRRIRRWLAGDAQASGEAIALVNLLARVSRAMTPLSDVLGTKDSP